METPETREKLANAIRQLQAKGDTATITALVSAYKAKYKTPAKTNEQLKNVGIVEGAKQFGKSAMAGFSTLPYGALALGARLTGQEGFAQKVEEERERVFEKPIEEVKQTTGGKIGYGAGALMPYLVPTTLQSKATQAAITKAPMATRLGTAALATVPDVAISAAQSGGKDIASPTATGVASFAANVIAPGSGGIVRRQLQTMAPGYIGDVASGMAGLRGEDRTGVNAFLPGMGTAITGALGALSNVKYRMSPAYKTDKITRIQLEINAEVDDLLKKTRSIQGQYQTGLKKHTDYKKYLSDPNVFSKLKVEGNKINPDEAIALIDGRINDVMNAKTQMLPFADKYTPVIRKQQILKEAFDNIAGKYTPRNEKLLREAIAKEVAALPNEMNVSQLDSFRARFRASARNAQGLPLDNEYTALENATRDMVFKATDNIPVDTAGEFAKANNYVKDMLNLREYLDKTIRNQIVKGGRLTNLTGRVLGGMAGTQGGFLASIVGQEIGGQIADILVNNQLGSAMKYRMIQNLTDNPQVLSEVEKILKQIKTYKQPLLPAPKQGAPRTATYGTEKITAMPPGSKGTYVGKAPAIQDESYQGLRPVTLSNQMPSPTAAKTISSAIDNTIPQGGVKSNPFDALQESGMLESSEYSQRFRDYYNPADDIGNIQDTRGIIKKPNERAIQEYMGSFKKRVDIENEIAMLEAEREFLGDAIEGMPGKELLKYRGKGAYFQDIGESYSAKKARGEKTSKVSKKYDTVWSKKGEDIMSQTVGDNYYAQRNTAEEADRLTDQYIKARDNLQAVIDTLKEKKAKLKDLPKGKGYNAGFAS